MAAAFGNHAMHHGNFFCKTSDPFVTVVKTNESGCTTTHQYIKSNIRPTFVRSFVSCLLEPRSEAVVFLTIF